MTLRTLAYPPTDGLRLPWSWCARCHRAYVTGTYRLVQVAGTALHPHPAALKLCPYLDCGGSLSRDGWHWSTVRAQHPEYPEQPELDTTYGSTA